MAIRLVRLGKLSLIRAYYNAVNLSDRTNNPWKREMMAPSYSRPYSVLWVMGEKDFHMMFSQMLMAIKREVPDVPTPYPLDRSSSIMIITTAENTNYTIMRIAFPAPNLSRSPYIPDHT